MATAPPAPSSSAEIRGDNYGPCLSCDAGELADATLAFRYLTVCMVCGEFYGYRVENCCVCHEDWKIMSFFLLVQDKKSSGLKAEREKNHDHHPVSVDQVCKSGVHATCPCKDLGHQPAVKLQG
ncbi:hypothetical protein ACOMHN_029867 [Nucella lapillus]